MPFAVFGMLLGIAGAIALFTSRSWLRCLAAQGVVYLGVFLVLLEQSAAGSNPAELAAIRLVGGWMALAVLGATSSRGARETVEEDAGFIFRIFLFCLIFLVSWSISGGTMQWIPGAAYEGAVTGALLLFCGLIRTGLVRGPMQVVLSLLSAFSGFELLFSAIDASALMAAMLAVSNLGLAMVGAYLGTHIDPAGIENTG
ncbi:MAG TPA: hypothetical protein VMN57_02155 [Anaerolineales bacterium]|nr:hypothetical protein [Anaerolineales bacterium]